MTAGDVAPASLRAAMERALESVPPTDEAPAARLARAGLAALASVVEGGGDRGSAADLLAADALITGACRAAAEAGPESLERLLAGFGLDRFEALLDREVAG